MRIDLHNHTVFSPDSSSTVEETIASALKNGMDGIAVTDHNSIKGSERALALAGGRLVVVTGSEVSTADGHLLCLGIKEDIPRGLPMAETVEKVTALGGVAVPSHPFRLGTGAGPAVLRTLKVQAIETLNGRNLNSRNRRAERYAREKGIGSTGGSDSHGPSEVGRAFTVLEGNGLSADDVLAAIAGGRCTGSGTGQNMLGGARTLFKIVGEYLQRGREHI